jgi:hypothetical protein
VTLSEPRRLVKFVAPPVAVPSEAELVQLARERGAAAVVRIVLATGPATLSLSRLEAATGRVEARQVIPLDDAEGGLRRFLDRSSVPVEALPRPAPPRAPTRWYRSPWFWGAVGVVATALVLTPFLLDGGGDGVDVRPAGDVPWP